MNAINKKSNLNNFSYKIPNSKNKFDIIKNAKKDNSLINDLDNKNGFLIIKLEFLVKMYFLDFKNIHKSLQAKY